MSTPKRDKKRSRFPHATPKLKMKMRRSFEEKEGPKKSMRNRLFSSPLSNESGLVTPNSRIGRALGSSKIFRTSTLQTRGLSGKAIASTSACGTLFDNKNLVNLSRPKEAESLLVSCGVIRKLRKKSSRNKLVQKMLKLKEGVVSLKTNDVTQSPSKLDKEYFKVWDIVSLKLDEKKSVLSVQVNLQKRMADENCSNRMDMNVTYIMKFSTEEQAKYVASVFVAECETFAAVIDINLGISDSTGNKNKHQECLLRKRYDLFNISRPQGDSAVKFALDRLINYLKQNGSELEAKFWEAVDGGEVNFSVSNLDTRCGLKAIFEERSTTKSEYLAQVEETIENFGVDKTCTTGESYFIRLYVKDELRT